VETPAITDPTSTRATSSSPHSTRCRRVARRSKRTTPIYCEVTRQGTALKDTTPIVFTKPEVISEVRPNPPPSLNDVQNMINSALERQAKSTDELLRRLIEERDRKKLDATSANPSSSTCAVDFTQTNPHTCGPSAGGTSMPNPSAQPMNHFHSRTTIEGLTPNLGMSQQATTSMYG
jgi:hypothetical protein